MEEIKQGPGRPRTGKRKTSISMGKRSDYAIRALKACGLPGDRSELIERALIAYARDKVFTHAMKSYYPELWE
jgi:hypothetical protein